ncbi:TPA: hypothetical protein EYP66_25555 [Candidatus Poribacteria bacterium]|nr:hypothetical protein [Candidatus Poribacteria bacterium]
MSQQTRKSRNRLFGIAALIGASATAVGALAAIIVPVVLWHKTPEGIKEISSAIRERGIAQQAAINEVGKAIVNGTYKSALGASGSTSMWRVTLTDDIAEAVKINLIARSGAEYVITQGGEGALGKGVLTRIQKAKSLLLNRDYYEAVAIGVERARLSDLFRIASVGTVKLPALIGAVAGYVGTIRAEAKEEAKQ